MTADSDHLKRALELAQRGRGGTSPNPIVGAVVVAHAEIVGEGWHEQVGGPHAEVTALRQAGKRARGATLYVSLEPCAHHGRTPPCVDAVVEAEIARVVVAARDPNPKTAGVGLERLLAAGIDVELPGGELEWQARVQNEGYRTWVSEGRPFVTYKVAVTLDGRVSVPGARWVSSEESRRLVHELRATVDAVAVGMGTVREDSPRLTARDVEAPRQPRRLAFGRGPLPEGSDLELRSGSLRDELERLAGEGVQTLLLEGGPTLASSFLEAGLIDKVLLFVAPTLSGAGLHAFGELPGRIDLLRLRSRQVGPDLLVEAYLREP